MSFHPGPGVGGHCIPCDPTYLSWQVKRDVGREVRVLEQAEQVNREMPSYVARRIEEALEEAGSRIAGSQVLVLGVAYKPDVGDIRGSPSIEVSEILMEHGARLMWHDPHVTSFSGWRGAAREPHLSVGVLRRSDCVALLTPHAVFDLPWVADNAPLVFDARNAFANDRRANVVRL
jgi:UDP-N-acetyl-D-glucosamine dehydrogenase